MIRCVVLDDEPLILRSIVRKIQHLNVEFKVVATAMNGLDGCRVIKEYRPDVIFTDIYMPIMNGLEVIACIQEERIQAKCVILSGYREFEFAKKALQYGVVDYLLKLIDNKKLEKLLKALMEEIGQKRLQEKKRLLESIKFGVPAPAAMTKADDLFFHAGKLVLFECKFCIGAYFADKIKPRELQQPAILDYELICRNACEENEYFLFYGTNPNEISIFFLIKAEENYKNIARQLYQAAKRQLKEGACLTCVVSHTVTSLNEVGRIEWETENTLYYGQIFSLSSFICCEEEKKKPFERPEKNFKG